SEAGEIADHPAAQCNNEIAAFDAGGDDGLADLLEDPKALRSFTGRDNELARRDRGFGQRLLDGIEVMQLDILIGDDEDPGARPQSLDARAQRPDQPTADDDVVAALAKRDRHGRWVGAKRSGHADAWWSEGAATFRCAASAVMTSATMASCGTSCDCTVRSASA